MKKVIAIWFLLCVLLIASACGGGGSEEESVLGYEEVMNGFIDAIFEGRYDDAKAMALEGQEYVQEVNDGVDAFAQLAEKYEFREVNIPSVSAWAFSTGGVANPEGDKRAQVAFHFREKGTETWKNGNLFVRILTAGGPWGIGDLQLKRPDK